MPAPIAARETLLRALRPGEGDVEGVLGALSDIARLVSAFPDEFHAGVDLKAVTPPVALIEGAAAVQLAHSIARVISQAKAIPSTAQVNEKLAEIATASGLGSILKSNGVQSRKTKVVRLLASCPTSSRGGMTAAAAQELSKRLEALFECAALQESLDAYVEGALEALGPSYLQVHEGEVLSHGMERPQERHAAFGKLEEEAPEDPPVAEEPPAGAPPAPSARGGKGSKRGAKDAAAAAPPQSEPKSAAAAKAPAWKRVLHGRKAEAEETPAASAAPVTAATALEPRVTRGRVARSAICEAPAAAHTQLSGKAAKQKGKAHHKAEKRSTVEVAAVAEEPAEPEAGPPEQTVRATRSPEQTVRATRGSIAGAGGNRTAVKAAPKQIAAKPARELQQRTPNPRQQAARGVRAAATRPTPLAAARAATAAPGSGRRAAAAAATAAVRRQQANEAALLGALEDDSPTPKRRKTCRWSPEQTDAFVKLVYTHGPGNWKAILEGSSDTFNNRTQVDLKDKWRNLAKAGDVLLDRMDQLRSVGLPPQ